MNQSTDEFESTLSADLVRRLSEAQVPEKAPADVVKNARSSLMDRVRQSAAEQKDVSPTTIRANEAEWVELMPKLEVKILLREPDSGIASYIFRLAPGFNHEGHEHPFDEECLCLEGSCTLSGVTLKPGDYQFAPKGGAHHHIHSDEGALLFVRGQDPLPLV